MAGLDSCLLPPARTFENDIEFTVYDWNKKFECKSLDDSDFKQYWAKNVPVIYSPKPDCDCLNLIYDEATAQRVLFAPLEQFICGSSDPSQVFERIKELSETPSLCGKVFKAGEPTYSCRDCGLDPTCVLCVDCFKNSAHRLHRYKMSASGGGGYCDCGDEEAWKSFSYCDNHHKGKSDEMSGSPLDKLPPEVIERLRLVMGIVLDYCHTMLTYEQGLSLPADLLYANKSIGKHDLPDNFCTVLFNDEIHTYEQVIETLNKAISCTKKAAIDFATMIDREGRSIVKSSTFAICNQVRHVIERVTARQASKLKVLVMQSEIIAHQTFALRLLAWLQKIVTLNEGFCQIFTNCIMEGGLLENVMLVDTQLWKTARNQWHQLFISGMLMEQNCKKAFAKSFTSVYPILLKEFIADDHDHSISVTSLSVQIFTVPTLAHALIQEENAITVVLRAFLSECEQNRNEDGKLSFSRSQNNGFRRAQYMLYDLGYLVTVTPSQWNDQIRKSFRNGLQSFFSLLGMMQGMDSVVRQVGQHVEYEAEWETGINLQLKVANVASLLLKWCGSDYAVFVKAFRANLKHFHSLQSKTTCVGVELANHSASCIEYDVASMPITIHLPLVRFLAGLFLHLEKFSLSYESPQFLIEGMERPSPEQLMELPLRTLVMLAQFRAGMWRRNGYSLLNQVYFYHNVRLRDEMYDRDILMLQIAASMIESNEFLIHLIYKYGLINWAAENYDGTNRKSEDDNIRQVLTVAEEFLSLVLVIVSERFTPGLGNVTESEKIKKEIIQLLCIEPMPHSQLFKMLPKDPNDETGMEYVVKEVAIFKKPQGPGTGKYELKPEYYKCFNPFYYHYTREEQSKAEEVQLKRKKQLCEEMCCPPPVPPEFCPRFAIIANILQCDVMLHIMELVLKRTLNLHSAAFSETQLEKVLHLIGVALHEEERATLAEKEGSFFCFTAKANKRGFVGLLEECLKSPRVDLCGEPHKDLLRWVLNKYKAVESLHVRDSKQTQELDVATATASTSESSAQDRKRKAEMAAARRARIMAQMCAMQKSFIKEHADMFKETLVEDSNLSKSEMDIYEELHTDDPVCFVKDSKWRTASPKIYTCILCREDQELTCAGRALVLAAFVQRSSILSKNRKHQLIDPETYDPLLLPADLFSAPHVSTCGHVMHSDCWQKFFESVLRKEQRRPLRFGRHTSFDVEKKEFLCPLCERLSNSVIPIIPPLSTLIPPSVGINQVEISMDEWLSAMKKVAEGFQLEKLEDLPDDDRFKNFPFLYKAMSLENATRQLSGPSCASFKELFSVFGVKHPAESGPLFSQNLIDMMKLFSEATYTVGLNINVNVSDVRIPSMAWWSCTYTIHAMEWLLRDKKKALFGAHSSRNALCLDAIIRFCGASLKIFDQDIIRTNCIRILRYLVQGEHYLSSPQCCLDFDAFSLLAFLVLSMPVLFESSEPDKTRVLHPLGTALDKHILHLLLTFHFVQVLLTYPFQEEENMDTDEMSEVSETSKLHGENVTALLFYEEVCTAAGFDQRLPAPSGHTIVHCLKTGSLPFLRCAAIFFHVLTDTPSTSALQEVNDTEFESICKYLGLPTTLDELLSSTSLKHLALSWARHPRTLHLLMLDPETSGSESLVRHPLSINKLVPLPSDYSELINSVSEFTCPNSDGDDSRNPTICLVCGTVLCSQGYCCQIDLNGTLVGACTNHAHFCGSGVGIFLRIRDCKILLLSDKNKGCFTAPPYVDEYGETDQGLFRGNPLHLCSERYEELHELWLSHNVPERVSHNMEQSTTLPNWQLL
ncbi:E3 ubiquitin-protein ligase UBR2-like [Stegodyphus dumicola]|uniref:E3 ubiquitin-protein ligase UBR2-like n=1 Tax=Stegodyphus dumicola TaxID=202533 RepID=UPI0015AD1967|nr:E3 ubiquitin-protein ligase UBR2-like [Stegodyphus dumicola]XP_035225376.1 E3 ubiquitin-protein ligase UBR2-like [Stegodyphus dumicola]